MKTVTLILVIGLGALSAHAEVLDEWLPQFGILSRLEKLSRERNYRVIFDSLAGEYRHGLSRENWVRKSEELSWIITKTQIGTFSAHGDFADAPVRSETLVGGKALRIDAVAFFVREGGTWKLWNFPFVDPRLPNRPQWPPPYEKRPDTLSPSAPKN